MPKTPPYSKEFKREAVQLLRSSGRPIPQLAKELAVSPQSLRNWASQRDVDAAARRRPRGLSASENAPTAPEGVSVRPPRGAKRLGLDASRWQTGLDNSWPNAAPPGRPLVRRIGVMPQPPHPNSPSTTDLRTASRVHAERAISAAAAAWADVWSEGFPASGRDIAHRAFERHLVREFSKCTDEMERRMRSRPADSDGSTCDDSPR